jgi:acyl carrier protein
MTDIAQKLRDYIRREMMADRPDAALDDDEPLIDGGIVDSLGIFLLVAFIEEQFGIKVQAEDVILDNFKSVSAIKDLVLARQASNCEVSP